MSNDANTTHKLFTSRVQVSANVYIGESGRMFYHEDTGELRLSDGVTPGGLPVAGGGGGGTVTLAGDITGSGPVGTSITTTLPNINADTGTFGNSTYVPTITVNSKGQIIAVTPTLIAGGGGSMVYPGAGIANSTGAAWGTSYSTTGTGAVVLATGTVPTLTAGNVSHIPNLTGDVTSIDTATTLATVNSSPGAFGNAITIPTFVVNAKGLVTSASNIAVAFPPQVYPAVGFAHSNGTSWDTSYNSTGTGNVVLDHNAILSVTNLTVTNTIIGNINGSSATAGNVIYPAQTTITSVGTLTGLTVTAPIVGNITGSAASATIAANVITNANLTGDVTSIGNATTLTTVNANVGMFGDSANIAQFTVNEKGLVTSAANVTVSIPSGSIQLIGDVTGTGTTGSNIVTKLVSITSLGDMIYGNVTGIATTLPGNTSNVQLFLSQTGTGVTSDAPSWQPIPAGGQLTYYFQDTASDVGGYKKQLTSQYSPLSNVTTAGVGAGQVLENWITDPGFPGILFIPSGTYFTYIHAAQTAGSKTSYIYAEVWETDASGVDIAKIGTTGNSSTLTSIDITKTLQFNLDTTYTLTSSNSRICVRIWGVATGGGSAPTIVIYYGGIDNSRLSFPSNQVDATNFLPYIGATANVDLGTHNLTTTGNILATTFTGNLVGNVNGFASNVITNADLTGDITSVGNNTTLATVNSNTGQWGDTEHVAIFTVNAKGLITSASNVSILAPNLLGGIAGSLPYQTAANTTAMLGIGGTNQILTVIGGLPTWQNPSGGAGGYPTIQSVTNNATYYPTFTTSTSGNLTVADISLGLSFNPSSNVITATGFVGNVTGNLIGFASNVITNADLTGDVTSIGNATTLATINGAWPAQFGNTIAVPQLTVNSKGLITSVANIAITFPAQVYPGAGIANSTGTGWGTSYNVTGTGNVVLDTSPTIKGTLTANVTGNLTGYATNVITNANLTGDVTSIGNATTLATVNSNTGQFGDASHVSQITVNGKGLITSASNISIPNTVQLSGDVTSTSGTTSANAIVTLNTVNSNTGQFGNAFYIPQYTVNNKGLITSSANIAIGTLNQNTTGSANNASYLGGLPAASYVTTTTLNNGTLAANVTSLVSSGNINVTTGSYFVGNGSYLTGLPSGMIYPGAGIPNSTGSAWSTSYQTTGTGNVVLDTSPTIKGTLTANVTGNLTGYATNVITNANLTGPITSIGNATQIALQTGTGNVFVINASPTLTGTPLSTTAAVNTNTTQIATTAFVVGQASGNIASNVAANVSSVGTSLRYSREDHAHALGSVGSGRILQMLTSTVSATNGTNTVTYNNTTPTTAFGAQIFSMSITPVAASSDVQFSGSILVDHSISNRSIFLFFFRGTTCIGTSMAATGTTGYPVAIGFQFTDTPATTAATTYTIRAATYNPGGGGGTWYINSSSAGARFGGTMALNSVSLTELL